MYSTVSSFCIIKEQYVRTRGGPFFPLLHLLVLLCVNFNSKLFVPTLQGFKGDRIAATLFSDAEGKIMRRSLLSAAREEKWEIRCASMCCEHAVS